MALKDSFINLNKALRTTLQNVPAVVDTLIRGFDEIGDAAEEENTYSTDERVVGKWIDGKKLYEKTVNIGALPNAATKSINISDLNIDKIIEFNGYATSDTVNIPVQYAVSGGTGFVGVATYYTRNNGNLTIEAYNDRTNYTECYLTIKYTKSNASRSPKNDTKNSEDEPAEDPDVKTVEPAEELKK